jgi:tetratricopeptide (TPR) repeat protein
MPTGDTPREWSVSQLVLAGIVIDSRGPPPGRGRAVIVASVQAADDPAIEFWTVCRDHDTMAESGQLERVATAAERMAAIAERVGDPTMRHDVTFARACMGLLRGDLAAAERGAAQALQISSDAGDPDAAMFFGARIMYVRLLQRRATEIVEQFEHSVRTYLGLLAAALGRDEQAGEHFARAIEIQERDGMLAWTARAHLGWAEALVASGRTELAREHATRALDLSREHGYGAFEPRAAAILEATISTGT